MKGGGKTDPFQEHIFLKLTFCMKENFPRFIIKQFVFRACKGAGGVVSKNIQYIYINRAL